MLNPRTKYLQIAFNRSLDEVERMVKALPKSERILVEAGTSFIKNYGQEGIMSLKSWWGGYVVADLKCMDRGSAEVVMAANAGANAATCLALAPISTIDAFIAECEKNNIDSMVDMMNVRFPFEILSKLKKRPTVVVLHRGVDEAENSDKEIPFMDINRIRATYSLLISVAGGEDARTVRRAAFNDANIVVVWKEFNEKSDAIMELTNEFLKEVR